LDIRPADTVLEIGCGNGRAASLICERLGRGRLTAIDRSKTMIAAARERNGAHVDSRKVCFEAVALADADFGRHAYSKILAISDQAGGRVFLFLHTDDFHRDHEAYPAHGVRFLEPPRDESYGTVAVFADLYGNKWDPART
jgi:SAM-dependent methyltransferase